MKDAAALCAAAVALIVTMRLVGGGGTTRRRVPMVWVALSEGISVAPPSRYGGVVGIAMQYLGVPYVWGGASPSGFDLFFDGLGHNGIYIGGAQFIHAPHTGDVVKISSLSDPWHAASWVGARRL